VHLIGNQQPAYIRIKVSERFMSVLDSTNQKLARKYGVVHVGIYDK